MIERILKWILFKLESRESLKTLGAQRSFQWRKTRAEHLKKFPACAVCGETRRNVEVHHLELFSQNPARENDFLNLVTLCESGNNGVVCHRFFGHRGDYRRPNPTCLEDVKEWRDKLQRP